MRPIYLILFSFCYFSSWAAEVPFSVHVQDTEGVPIPNAQVIVFWPPGRDNAQECIVNSDKNGDASCLVSDIPGVAVTANGYYKNRVWEETTEKEFPNPIWSLNRPKVIIVLQKVLRTVGMYNRQIKLNIFPQIESFAFDFEIGDFVAPNGHGVKSDMMVRVVESVPYPNEWDRKVNVTFAGDGCGLIHVPIKKPQRSDDCWFPREAPLIGYMGTWSYEEFFHGTRRGIAEMRNRFSDFSLGSRKPGQELERLQHTIEDNYIFRIRSEPGKPDSGWYGKILGPITLTKDRMAFAYYLNPAGRSLEYNGTNLAKPTEK